MYVLFLPHYHISKEASSFNTHKTLSLATVRVPVLFKALAVKHPKPCWVRSPSHQSVPNQITRWSFYQKWKWIRSDLPLRGCKSATLGLQFLSQHSKFSKRSENKARSQAGVISHLSTKPLSVLCQYYTFYGSNIKVMTSI